MKNRKALELNTDRTFPKDIHNLRINNFLVNEKTDQRPLVLDKLKIETFRLPNSQYTQSLLIG